jgi:ABC-type branched-subunit amino acid transport system ATPase component
MSLGVRARSADRNAGAGEPGAEPVPLLRVDAVDFAYGAVQVLFGASFSVQPGEAFALVGANGAGKSTVLRVIAGLAAPSAGQVLFDGEDITSLPVTERVRRGIVLVAGGQATFPDLTVRENLDIGAYVLRREPHVVAERTAEVLELFPRLKTLLSQPAGTLSGGEQQQLGLGKALLLRPRLLCVDELSMGLAPVVVGALLESLSHVRSLGTTLVVVEQSLKIAASVCDRAAGMEKGAVNFEGRASDLLEGDRAHAIFFSGGGARS